MSSTVKKLPKSQVEITITVPYTEYKAAEARAIADLSKEMKVDGFRPGHVPENVIRERVNADTINGMSIERVIPTTYSKAVQEHKLQVIAQPTVDIKAPVKNEGDELVYVATVSVMPEVKLGDYKKIKVKKKEVTVTPQEVEDTINMLMARFATWNDVSRAAQDKDRVELDFEGFDEKGVAIPNTASKNHPVVLGSKSMIPGFEDQVGGMTVGQNKEFDIKFPDDYHAKNMQGRLVKFKVTLNRIEEKEAQVLDEAMVEKISGQKQSVDDFKTRIEADLKVEMQRRAQADTDNEVVGEIIKITTAELPDSLIQDEITVMKEERKKQVSRQGLTWEQYLQHVKKTEDDFIKDHQKPAQERLLARLGVNEIIKQEKITASDEEVNAKVQEIVGRYPEESRQSVLDHYKPGSQGYSQLKNNLAADKLIQMFVE